MSALINLQAARYVACHEPDAEHMLGSTFDALVCDRPFSVSDARDLRAWLEYWRDECALPGEPSHLRDSISHALDRRRLGAQRRAALAIVNMLADAHVEMQSCAL